MGFKLLYETSNVSKWTHRIGKCGGNFNTPNGIITSPSYPESYPENMDCTYLISVPNGTFINMTVITVDIYCRTSGEKGIYDSIEFRNGDSENSPLMRKWCEDKSPTLRTTQNHLRIR